MANFDKHIIIVGSARSGTSWLSELMAQPKRHRLLFEPEHETHTSKGKLICDRWLSSSEEDTNAIAYLTKIFRNRVDNDWIAQNSNRTLKRHLWPFVPKLFIIKFVRANLLQNLFIHEFKIPVIHLVRNPYDVLQSQTRANFDWLLDFRFFQNQPKLVDVLKNDYTIDLFDLGHFSRIQILALRWCIENVVASKLIDEPKDKLEMVKYENLIQDMGCFVELCHRLNIPISDSLELIYKRPSSKTHKKSAIRTKKKRVSIWTDTELKEINGILAIFDQPFYQLKELNKDFENR